ncbi:MAG: cholesterol oxidase [Candidatus Marinimicrobia bacterium]|nr:cholesterol oxidase [Candidatus Neomarinimicrobiota bacterium]|tara:strand:+ start:9121 stop:10707 length:1587 start_codon:yes stop_codon:yes gene_type:complete
MDKIDQNYDVVIIGSGFGGSVSALRLAEKKYKVLVIEKGKRYNSSDFPKTNWNLRKFLWLPKFFLYGIQCITLLKNVFILHGAGVGGGSLVYANTLLVPPDKAFKDKRWIGGQWKEKLTPFYKQAKEMLGATPAPYLGETDYILKDAANRINKSESFSPVDVGIFFNKSNDEVKDPYFQGKGPNRNGCVLCGGCMVGCRYNAKNTLDKNYLYLAENLGVQIAPEKEVVSVKTNKDNGYIVEYKNSTGILKSKGKIYAKKVIFSGGVMGSIKLLFKCKTEGYLSKISDCLGDYVRTNSESILAVRSQSIDKKRDFNKGIAISAGFTPDNKTHIETCRYGKGQNSMSLLTTHLFNTDRIPGIIKWFFDIIFHPIRFIRDFIPYKWSSQTVILLIMQPISNYLKFSYERRWWRFGGKSINSSLSSGNPIPSSIPIGEEIARDIAKDIKGVPMSSYMDTFFGIPTTAHILGGATMGDNINNGVVDDKFEIFNYPGLYVIDGSVVPSNLGVNPSLTITALAEYAMSKFPENEQ